jgi:hypothetical protein
MSLQLRPDVYWCVCGGRAVFLDTRGDRYFCLPQSDNDAFLRVAASQQLPSDAAQLRSLVESKVLIEIGALQSFRQPPMIKMPTHDVIEYSRRSISPAMLPMFLAEIRTATELRRRPLHELLTAAREQPLQTRRSSSEPVRATEKIASAAAALSFITGRHDRCLVRALAVHALCKRNGSKANLVFGVIAHPFTAHCWVQLGRAVVVGGYEHARLYTPILVI